MIPMVFFFLRQRGWGFVRVALLTRVKSFKDDMKHCYFHNVGYYWPLKQDGTKQETGMWFLSLV